MYTNLPTYLSRGLGPFLVAVFLKWKHIYLKNQKNTIRPDDGSQQLKAFAAISSDGSLHAWGDPAAGGSLDVAWLKYVTAVWCCKVVGSPDYSNRFK